MRAKRDFTNSEITHLLESVAAAYEIKGESKFRIGAYLKAADSIRIISSDLTDFWKEGRLDEVPGIGKNLQFYLDELFKKGKVKHFEEVLKSLPPAMFVLLDIPGIGAKTAYKLTINLKLKNPKTVILNLEKKAKEGQIRHLEGFGEQSEKDILKAIEEYKGRTTRMTLPVAYEMAMDVVTWLKKSPDVVRVEPLGSLRRMSSTVGDIDLAVATDKPTEVIKHFIDYPKSLRKLEAGTVTASLLTKSQHQIDLMIQPVKSFGALLQHFTGSKNHNIHLREFALKKGLSLSEYGIKKGGKITTYQTEEEFYRALGLKWIPSELREDKGEIEAALSSKLPKLVEVEDIKGDLHLHSNFPIETSHDEGVNDAWDFLKTAKELNYEYLALTEHNPSSSQHHSKQIIEILKKKRNYIEKINYSNKKSKKYCTNNLPIYIFNSLEIDIKPDGSLAIPDKAFDFLDFAVVSVHSSFNLSKTEMTKRILAAFNHPKAKILGHPTGRKLNLRPAIDADWEEIFEYCLKNKKWLEINSWPERLDLPDDLVQEAVKSGVGMVISTDSHRVDQMDLIKFGVSVARRGWAEKNDIINTLSYNQFLKELKKLRGGER